MKPDLHTPSATASGPFQRIPPALLERLREQLRTTWPGGAAPPVVAASVRGAEVRVELGARHGTLVATVQPHRDDGRFLVRSRRFDVGHLGGDDALPADAVELVRSLARALDAGPMQDLIELLINDADPAAAALATDEFAARCAQLVTAFVDEGLLAPFDVDACDHSPDVPPRQLGPSHLLLRDGGEIRTLRTDAPSHRGSPLVVAKNVLGHAELADGRRLRPVPRCSACRVRFDCAVTFEADAPSRDDARRAHLHALVGHLSARDGGPVVLGSPAFCDLIAGLQPSGDAPGVVVEATSLLTHEGRRALASHLHDGDDETVLVVGRAPRARVGTEAHDGITTAEPAMVAMALRDSPLRLRDYRLPGRDGADPWVLRYGTSGEAPARPEHATLVVNRRCVTVCRYCNLPLRLRKSMTLEQAFATIEEARVLGVQRVEFFGGEVTLRKDLFDMLGYARHLGLQTFLTTTGVGLDDVTLEALAAQRVTDISISVDSPDPAVHDYLKNREGMHEAALHAATTLKRLGAPWVGLNSVITRQNFRQLGGVVGLAADLGLDGAIFFFCQPLAEIGTSSPSLNEAEAQELLREILPAARERARQRGVSVGVRPALDRIADDTLPAQIATSSYCRIFTTEDPCRISEQLFSVDPEGAVRLCNQPIMQFEASVAVGNLWDRPLVHILSSPEADDFRRRAGRLDGCRHCTFDHASSGPRMDP